MKVAHHRLGIDERSTLWRESGFSWWTGGFAQHISFEGPYEFGDGTLWGASFKSDFLKGLTINDPFVETFVHLSNRWSNHFTCATEGDRVVHRGRIVVPPEQANKLARLLADRAAIAHEMAVSQASGLSGVTADSSEHPSHLGWTGSDKSLVIIDRLIREEGTNPMEHDNLPNLTASMEMLSRTGARVGRSQDGTELQAQGYVNGLGYTFRLHLNTHNRWLGWGAHAFLEVGLSGPGGAEAPAMLASYINNEEWVSTDRPLVGGGPWVCTEIGPVGGPIKFKSESFFTQSQIDSDLVYALAGDAIFRVMLIAQHLVAKPPLVN